MISSLLIILVILTRLITVNAIPLKQLYYTSMIISLMLNDCKKLKYHVYAFLICQPPPILLATRSYPLKVANKHLYPTLPRLPVHPFTHCS